MILHSMALTSRDEARCVGFSIIELNKGLIPQITWIKY
jgi:hypothetical protein